MDQQVTRRPKVSRRPTYTFQGQVRPESQLLIDKQEEEILRLLGNQKSEDNTDGPPILPPKLSKLPKKSSAIKVPQLLGELTEESDVAKCPPVFDQPEIQQDQNYIEVRSPTISTASKSTLNNNCDNDGGDVEEYDEDGLYSAILPGGGVLQPPDIVYVTAPNTETSGRRPPPAAPDETAVSIDVNNVGIDGIYVDDVNGVDMGTVNINAGVGASVSVGGDDDDIYEDVYEEIEKQDEAPPRPPPPTSNTVSSSTTPHSPLSTLPYEDSVESVYAAIPDDGNDVDNDDELAHVATPPPVIAYRSRATSPVPVGSDTTTTTSTTSDNNNNNNNSSPTSPPPPTAKNVNNDIDGESTEAIATKSKAGESKIVRKKSSWFRGKGKKSLNELAPEHQALLSRIQSKPDGDVGVLMQVTSTTSSEARDVGDLVIEAGVVIDIVEMDNCPPGKWMGRAAATTSTPSHNNTTNTNNTTTTTNANTIGFVTCCNINIDAQALKDMLVQKSRQV